MRTESITREIQAGVREPASDIQLLMHGAWLVAGIAIALASAGCTVADEADLHASPAPGSANVNVAHMTPQAKDPGGNVQDLTY
jgi:uncharacterized membrane protein